MYSYLKLNYIYLHSYCYLVTKCVPELKDQDFLEEHLNKTEDFPGFITRIHSLFVKAS